MTRLLVMLALLTLPRVALAQTEEVRYFHSDAIGSMRLVTDENGQVIESYDYLPFGEPYPSSTSTETRRFGGKERDSETGFDYFGARYYSSGNGRFTTVDPLLDVAGAIVNPQRWNRYAYVSNNPLRSVDPDGRQQLDANLVKMLELLKAPRTAQGIVRGSLIDIVADYTIRPLLGEMFGYVPNAIRGGLTPDEYRQLMAASAYEKSALMLGVGEGNAPAIDAVDLTHGTGVSLKTAANANRLIDNTKLALEQVENAGFYNVNLYIEAKSLKIKDLDENKIRSFINKRIIKIVVFTEEGPVEYVRTEQ